ncbi:MAG: phosphotransferase [Legionellaceae bacterium]|nr:phosphotransferase [Legionellaceae bacterium]
MHIRENALKDWLTTLFPDTAFTVSSLTGDASFRRYYRLHTANTTQIIMDTPPDKIALEPFIQIGQFLRNKGFTTPIVHAIDYTHGFVLLSDFGDDLFLQVISSHDADALYKSALKILAQMQLCSTEELNLATFDKPFMLNELSLFQDWFLERYLGLTLEPNEKQILHDTYDWLTDMISNQPKVFVHRDYHSRNIMLVPRSPPLIGSFSTESMDRANKSREAGTEQLPLNLGIIDFQDAMLGPFTYDVVSLLKDCYIQWPSKQVTLWLTYFYEQLAVSTYSLTDFKQAFDLCGLQRHIRVLGTFCRLFLRDNKPNYLQDLPLTFHYMMTCLERYDELQLFHALILNRVQPTFLSKIE